MVTHVLLMVFALGLAVALVAVRKQGGVSTVSALTATNIINVIVDPAQLKAQARVIKIMRQRIRWARRRLEKPHLCKKGTLKRALRYLSEAQDYDHVPEVRSYLRVQLNLMKLKISAKIKQRLELALTQPAPLSLKTSNEGMQEFSVQLANAA